MYQRARKLHDLIGDPSQLLALAEEQLEAYVVAMNSLALLDRPNAWIVMHVAVENGREVRKSIVLFDVISSSGFAAAETAKTVETYPGVQICGWEI
jgi:nuclear pore complex protein Nup160